MFRMFTIALIAGAFASSPAIAQTPPASTKSDAPPPAPAQSVAPVEKAAAQASSGVEAGKLAWYGRKFAGRRTASGEVYNPDAMTMAHKTLPFGSRVKVTNVKNKKSATLRVNDRGPTQPDRVGDVSLAAARQLGMVRSGVIDAELEVVADTPATKR